MTPQPVTWTHLALSPPSPDLEHPDEETEAQRAAPDQASHWETRGLGSAWLPAQAAERAGPLTSSSWETLVSVTSLPDIQGPENLGS